MSDGVGVKIQNNNVLVDILRDILDRSEEAKNTKFGPDSAAGYKTLIASLETVIKLLEMTSGQKREERK
jgi:hypothetical protein